MGSTVYLHIKVNTTLFSSLGTLQREKRTANPTTIMTTTIVHTHNVVIALAFDFLSSLLHVPSELKRVVDMVRNGS
jgi:hypothetical protein